MVSRTREPAWEGSYERLIVFCLSLGCDNSLGISRSIKVGPAVRMRVDLEATGMNLTHGSSEQKQRELVGKSRSGELLKSSLL